MPLRVLMLGWEFPPFITGGLGTACYGLVKAMDRAGMETTFVLPKSVPGGAVEEARAEHEPSQREATDAHGQDARDGLELEGDLVVLLEADEPTAKLDRSDAGRS